MAIEKFSGKFSKEDGGCTILINATINSIRNSDGLALYTYLSCRPEDWNLNVHQLMDHFTWGENKTYKILKYLQKTLLLKKIETREKGKFLKCEYILMLRPIEPLDENHQTANVGSGIDVSPFDDLPQPVLATTGEIITHNKQRDLLNKDNNIYIQPEKISFPEYKKLENLEVDENKKMKDEFKKHALAHKLCISAFNSLWKETGTNIEEAYDTCQLYWTSQNKIANWANFKNYLVNPKSLEPFKPIIEPVDNSFFTTNTSKCTNNLAKNYQEYVGRTKADINLQIKPPDTVILNYEDWKNEQRTLDS